MLLQLSQFFPFAPLFLMLRNDNIVNVDTHLVTEMK